MRRAVLLALLATACAAVEFEGIAALASHHWQEDEVRERNPGIGVAVRHGQVGASAIVYKDSLGETAHVVAACWRHEARWGGLELAAGYMASGSYDGPIIVPTYLTPGPVRFGVSVLGDKAVGFSLRVEL